MFKMLKWIVLVGVVLILPSIVYAGSAQVLPKGIWNIDLTYYNYFDITQRYDENGDPEPLAITFNDRVDGSDLPPAFGLGASDVILDLMVDFTWVNNWWEFGVNYGLTDKLSVGAVIYYSYSKNIVNASVDQSIATMIKNPCFNDVGASCTGIETALGMAPGSLAAAFIFPIDLGMGALTSEVIFNDLTLLGLPADPTLAGNHRVNMEDVQDYFGQGLVLNGVNLNQVLGTVFGYDRIESWSGSGINDMDLKVRYQFHNKPPWVMAVTGGVKLPTGKVASPDSFVERGFGGGLYSFFADATAEYSGIKKLNLAATVDLSITPPDKEELRVITSVDSGLAVNKAEVTRNIGEGIGLNFSGAYALNNEFAVGASYYFTTKLKDSYSGDDPTINYSVFEEETEAVQHTYKVSLSYSTFSKFLAKKFPIPLYAKVEYRNRFAGKNNYTKSEYISLNGGFLF